MLRVHCQDDAVHVLDKRIREPSADLFELRLELIDSRALVVDSEHKLGHSFVTDP